MSYLATGDDAALIKWYEDMCKVTGRSWYCDMQRHLTTLKTATKPMPPPKPPPFVAVDVPPAEIAEGSQHAAWWEEQARKQQKRGNLLMFAALGVAAVVVLPMLRKKR